MMGISSLVAASGGKTRYVVSLTSGTSWTVPAGVNYVNATCYGAGGGGAPSYTDPSGYGGTTTFATNITAPGGTPGPLEGATAYPNASGASGGSGTGLGGHICIGAQTSSNVALHQGGKGAVISGTVNTTPGSNITYSIGAGGYGGGAYNNSNGVWYYAGTGGTGRIDVEYWL